MLKLKMIFQKALDKLKIQTVALENKQEQADAGEIFHLWDHLTFRYDNIYQTQYWSKDSELKLLLKKGLQGTWKVQAKQLEQELSKFSVPLQFQPPALTDKMILFGKVKGWLGVVTQIDNLFFFFLGKVTGQYIGSFFGRSF